MPKPVTLPEILEAAQRSGQAQIHTSIPGIVRAYVPATQRADIEIAVADYAYAEDEAGRNDPRAYDATVVVPSVRVQFPSGGGGYGIVFGLLAGDHVTLLFSERSTSEFEASGQPSQPRDARRHSMGHPVAIPGYLSDDKEFGTLATTQGLKVGKDANSAQIEIVPDMIKCGVGATDFAALASVVDANFTNIKSFLTSLTMHYVAHQHATAAPGPPVPTAPPFSGAPPTPDPVACTLVKVK